MSQLLRPVIDLDQRHFTRRSGDIAVIGTWSLMNDRPLLALVPWYENPSHDRVTPCLVPLDLAWLWAEETGDPAHIAQTSFQFAAALGFNPMGNLRAVFEVTAAVQDHLGDLLAMPPRPPTYDEVLAEAMAVDTDSGKVIDETEIKGDV